MKIEKCPLCHGDCHVESYIAKKDGVDYSKYYDEHGLMSVLPPLSEMITNYYCTCDKHCFAIIVPTAIVGESYPTEQEAITEWNDFVAQWNKTLKGGDE